MPAQKSPNEGSVIGSGTCPLRPLPDGGGRAINMIETFFLQRCGVSDESNELKSKRNQ